jgi:hypothetical protein
VTFHRGQTGVAQFRAGPPRNLRREPRLEDIKFTRDLLDQNRGLEQLKVRELGECGIRRGARIV